MKFLFYVALVCTSWTCKAEDKARYLVRYKNKEGLEEVLDLDDPYHAASSVQFSDIMKRHKITTIKATPEVIETLKASKNIVMVEEDLEMSIVPTIPGDSPSSASEETPYGITMVQAPDLWKITKKREKMTVCVVDTGYNVGHEDLPTTDVHGVDGWNPSESGSGLWNVDGHGHGTHCAGTIGAIGDNEIGVTSVNPDPTDFKFFIGKGLSDSGSGTYSGIYQALRECANNKAKVISLSLGGGTYSDIGNSLYKEIYDEGILIIAAAGNNANSKAFYPASYKHVMSVGAVDSNEKKAGFSTFNDQTEIAAPGVSTKSTWNDGKYKSISGTSMACPHVAGVALMVWSHFPTCKNSQIRNVLIRSAAERGQGKCNPEYGHGIIQGKSAYDLLEKEGCTAGGVVTSPLSDNNYGGCEQGPPTGCLDDSSFSKNRGNRQRTCDYIGKGPKYRKMKWCNKMYRGVKIHKKCCATCTGFIK